MCFTAISFKSLIIDLPVLESKAPVGSSQRSSLGFLATALAIETLCCSPPDNLDGKELALSLRPTSFKISSGLNAFLQTSVASSMFSRAVKLGIKL